MYPARPRKGGSWLHPRDAVDHKTGAKKRSWKAKTPPDRTVNETEAAAAALPYSEPRTSCAKTAAGRGTRDPDEHAASRGARHREGGSPMPLLAIEPKESSAGWGRRALQRCATRRRHAIKRIAFRGRGRCGNRWSGCSRRRSRGGSRHSGRSARHGAASKSSGDNSRRQIGAKLGAVLLATLARHAVTKTLLLLFTARGQLPVRQQIAALESVIELIATGCGFFLAAGAGQNESRNANAGNEPDPSFGRNDDHGTSKSAF
jgi:hypothetical protein